MSANPVSSIPVSRRAVLSALAAASVTAAVTHARTSPAHADPDDVLRVSSLGHDPVDSTRFLQEALDSDASTVIIDRVPGGWTTEALFLRRSNVHLIIEPGVTLQAKAGGFQDERDRLLQIEDCTDVVVSGYGATIRMNKPEYTTGEWRNAMRLYAVENVTVEGLVLRDSGGDGISVTGRKEQPSRNIVLRDIVSDNNRRNALSVATVVGMEITGCAFLNSVGTPPQCGVDFEPEATTHELTDIRMQDCYISHNLVNSLTVVTNALDTSSAPIDITVERTTIGTQIGGSPQVQVWGDIGPGQLELRDCLLNVNPNSCAVGNVGIPGGGMVTKLHRTSIWNLGNPFNVYETFMFEARGADTTTGNLTLVDAVLVTDQPPTFLRNRTPTKALHHVTGDITVINPNGAVAEYGPDPVDVTLAITEGDPAARSQVRIAALGASVAGGAPARFRFSRLSGSLAETLTIAYNACGSARERYDYGGLGRVVTIAPGQRHVDLEIRTHARHDPADPVSRHLALAIADGPTYTVEGRVAQVEIHD